MNKFSKISGGNQLIDPYFVLEKVGLTEGMKVADLGCGAVGHFILPSAKIVGEKGTAYAVDILKSVLEAVKNRAKLMGLTNLETVWSNLEIVRGAKGIADESLDRVFLFNILSQVSKKEEVFKEAERMLKNKGYLSVIDWKMEKAPLGPPVERRVRAEEVKRLAGNIGLKEKGEFIAGSYHYGLIFEK